MREQFRVTVAKRGKHTRGNERNNRSNIHIAIDGQLADTLSVRQFIEQPALIGHPSAKLIDRIGFRNLVRQKSTEKKSVNNRGKKKTAVIPDSKNIGKKYQIY